VEACARHEYQRGAGSGAVCHVGLPDVMDCSVGRRVACVCGCCAEVGVRVRVRVRVPVGGVCVCACAWVLVLARPCKGVRRAATRHNIWRGVGRP
jgi:hypothetical protein